MWKNERRLRSIGTIRRCLLFVESLIIGFLYVSEREQSVLEHGQLITQTLFASHLLPQTALLQ